MNDMTISRGNPYPNPVELQGNGQNVNRIGGSKAGVGTSKTSEKSNLTLVQGEETKSEKQTYGANKNVLILPRATMTKEAALVGVDAALTSFLAGWQPAEGSENTVVDKNGVLKERRAEDEEIKEQQIEGETDLVIHQVMSNAEKVSIKAMNDDAQITMQSNSAKYQNAVDSAKQTAEAENKDAKISELVMNVFSAGLSFSGSFVKAPDVTAMTKDAAKVATERVEKTKKALEVSGKLLNIAMAGVKFAEISDEGNESVVENKKKEAGQALSQSLGAVAQYSTQKVCQMFDGLQKTLNAIVNADLQAQGQMPVTAN